MKSLIARRVTFFTQRDEEIFFGWLHKINIVGNVSGSSREIVIEILEEEISDLDLKELITIFWRYRLDHRQLSMFVHDRNRKWFADPGMVWHRRIFGLDIGPIKLE